MCGIAGLAMRDGSAVPIKTLELMSAALRHRGPDDSGIAIDRSIGLAHRRLSIIDLSATGHQPMVSDAGDVSIVFNGEVYNYLELRMELLALGFAFRGQSDTEVVLNAFVAWGRDAFAKLNGMFAFAVWDKRRHALTLVRDRFGIKPLFYVVDDKCLAFASEIKGLRPMCRETTIEPQALAEYMYYGNSLGRNTLVAGVRRLEPGHWLELADNDVSSGCYWSVISTVQVSVPVGEAVAEVRKRLEAAVRRQMVSDVPIGVFLSGGVDSTAVVSAAARFGRSRLDTFTVRFDFAADNGDVAAARRVAEHFDTNHHELDVSGYQLDDVLASLIDAHDLPFGDAANVPLFLLAKELKGNPKVILQGDGGDELFAGYRRYSLLAQIRWLGPLARQVGWLLNGVPHAQLRARLSRMVRALGAKDPAERMAFLLTEEKPDRSPFEILSDDWRERVAAQDAFARYREVGADVRGLDAVQSMLFTDLQVLLPDIFLEKVDRSTMAQSIEVRVPLLDHDLADYVLSLPSDFKVRGGVTKWIFKQALAGLVPDFVLQRKKAGFGVPYAQWLRGPLYPLVCAVLLDPVADRHRLFDRTALRKRVDEHVNMSRDHGFLLWKALQLGLWQSRLP